MAEYTQIDEDNISKSETVSTTTSYDLASLIQQLKDIKNKLDSLVKTVPDQETLDFWNTMQEGEKFYNISEANSILAKLLEIYKAEYLPAKYVAPLTSYNQWLNNL